ncbi:MULTISPECIES: DUF2267 domain-containing protein [unclassified Streptomyces]|uniref:DUF2267 domain-containing protein n=1 Tax=unclassified Streptomyces TaxID=2593676 RepID=UPI003D7625FD
MTAPSTTFTTSVLEPAGPSARAVIPAPAGGRRGQPGGAAASAGWSRLVGRVREAGQYTTAAEAERIVRIVLSALGGHVIGDERVALARALPPEGGAVVAAQVPVTRPQTAARFVDGVAARVEGATPATARWDVSSVLGVLPEFVGDGLVDRLIAELPPGYALLFGRAELAGKPTRRLTGKPAGRLTGEG